jgi:hypothetical protein
MQFSPCFVVEDKKLQFDAGRLNFTSAGSRFPRLFRDWVKHDVYTTNSTLKRGAFGELA